MSEPLEEETEVKTYLVHALCPKCHSDDGAVYEVEDSGSSENHKYAE